MAFIDSITLDATSGRGGRGVVRWRSEKGRPHGGPCGGNGGRGGDIYLEGVRDISVLLRYRYLKRIEAESGHLGGYNNKHGANGEPYILKVPIGTVAHVPELERTVEIVKEGERVRIFSGGMGGFGNDHFKSSTNQNPFEFTEGKSGEKGTLNLNLKLIADAGLIGLPSAGKSSLLNALTRARAKVGDYPFTTLEPNLGDFYGRILADIPGLIEGASSGKGLGAKFLKHIERTGILIHLVSVDQDDPVKSYKSIRNELELFGEGLSDKKEIIVISKADLGDEDRVKTLSKTLKKITSSDILVASIYDEKILKEFSDNLTRIFSTL